MRRGQAVRATLIEAKQWNELKCDLKSARYVVSCIRSKAYCYSLAIVTVSINPMELGWFNSHVVNPLTG